MMNRELQERLFAELGKQELPWKTSPNHETEAQALLRWLSIANLTAARIELGLSSDARWVRATSQSVTVFRHDKPCVFLLPVLEVDLGEARRALEQGLQARGLSTEFVSVFPFEDVVTTGLESHSEHWIGLALKWAEQLPVSSKLQSALQSLASNGPTQKARHAAQKLLAQQRRSGTKED
jgi:hypothetical protein